MKRPLYKVLDGKLLSKTEMNTVLTDCEAASNMRPLTATSEVTDDNKNFHVDGMMFHDDFFLHVKAFLKQISNDLVMQSHRFNYEYSKYITKMKQHALQVGGKVLFDM